MTQPNPKRTTRDQAILRIGRNVVNFQRLEKLLKLLVFQTSAEGTPESIKKKLAKKAEATSKRSLGQLADALHKDIFAPPLDLDWVPADTSEISFAFRMTHKLDAETAETHKQELRDLVDERNRLIHQELGEVDFESDHACRELVAKLDVQDASIQKQMERLRSLWQASSQAMGEVMEYIRSDEFTAILRQEQDE